MTIVTLVRHARPAAAWGTDPDPGLDDVGRGQADATARSLAAESPMLPIFTSPLRRCRETAAALVQQWGRPAVVLDAVAEIPAPPLDAPARRLWLEQAMAGTWQALQDDASPGSPDYLGWRNRLVETVRALEHDCVVFSHFIAINAVVGAALGREELVCFRPDHASVTRVAVDGSGMRVVELGGETTTLVLPGR